jgi:vancomycin permeability regulator SanA
MNFLNLSIYFVTFFSLLLILWAVYLGFGISIAEKRALERGNSFQKEKENRLTIIVFGAKALSTGPSNELATRLDLAIGLGGKNDPTNYYVCGGFSDDGRIDEAETMRKYLTSWGVEPQIIHPSSFGLNTRLSIRNFQQEELAMNSNQILAVSSGYHAFRIMAESNRIGIHLTVAASTNSPESKNPKIRRIRILLEILGCMWYSLPIAATKRVNTGSGSLRQWIPDLIINGSKSKVH